MRKMSIMLGGLSLLVVGCSRGATGSQPAPGSRASAPPSDSAAPGTLALGERITLPVVPLADVAKEPSRFKGRVFATSGKITAVCQEMGCWMELQDASGNAHVRMHGHAFFVPKTAPGHLARVQATIVEPAGATDCEEGKSAKIDLDATGVEID
jgi:Domain of unknown function (DUF4920)